MKEKHVGKRILALTLAVALVLAGSAGLSMLSGTLTAKAAEFTAESGGTTTRPTASNRLGTFDTGATVKYVLGGNEWYGVNTNGAYWELVDTDATINGTALSSQWGSGTDGTTILNYANGLAATYFSKLKSGGAMKTKTVDTADKYSSGTGSITGAYMWPLSYSDLNANTTLGGKLYSNAGTYVWSRSSSGSSFAYYVNNASGGLYNGIGVTSSYRVAPAFDLDLTKVLILREAQSPQSFGPYSTTSGSSAYLTVSVGSQYANGFSVTTNGSTSISGKKLTGDTATGEYTLQYKSAASGGTVCAILYDGSKVKYYGSLGTASSTSGSVTMDLGSISAGTYTMAVYEEDTANGYASTPVICKLVVTSEDAAKEDNTVTAPEGFTSSEEGASNIPSASNRIDALDTTGTTTYHLGNNGWYGVTDETGTWELVDTDGKFGSTNSASVWGTDYSGQTILDYTNGLADTNLASLKSAGVLQTKDVDTKDVGTSGTGSLTGAYMWPLSKTQLDGNATLAGKLYTSTGTSVWTRSFNDYIAGSMRYDAWLVTDNKGTMTSTEVTGSNRVNGAISLDVSKILVSRKTASPQGFAAYDGAGAYLVADVGSQYADGFTVTYDGTNKVDGKTLTGTTSGGTYTLQYTGAVSGGKVSIILYQTDGSIAYYGTPDLTGTTNGSLYLYMPEIEEGTYTMAIFEENVTNGYASTPVLCTLAVSHDDTPKNMVATSGGATAVPSISSLLGSLDTTATTKYKVAGNEWYGVSSGTGYWELVDTDSKINGIQLKSSWGSATDGTLILNFTNGVADGEYLSTLKSGGAMKTKSVDTKDVNSSGTGSLSAAYMWPLSYTDLNANKTLGGALYTNAGASVWTRSSSSSSYAFSVYYASGGLNNYYVTNSSRVAPAFNLDLTKVAILRASAIPQSFGPYTAKGSNLIVNVGNSYANGFTVSYDGSTSIKGKKITLYSSNTKYQFHVANAASDGMITAVLYDESGTPVYYGAMEQSNKYSNLVTLDATNIDAGTYTLLIMDEDTASGLANATQVCTLTIVENGTPDSFTATGSGAVSIPTASNKVADTPNTDGTVTYHLGGNEWYGVESGSYLELVDTDASFDGTALSSTWGSGTDGSTLLNYADGLAATYFPELKNSSAMHTKDVNTKDKYTSGTGSVSGAYMWPLSWTDLNGNTALGGALYSSTGASLWTRSSYSSGNAYLLNSATGTLASSSATGSQRVAPAFELNLAKVLISRGTPLPQSFGPYKGAGDSSYLTVFVGSQYADGFGVTLKDDTAISGKKLEGHPSSGYYSLKYSNAEAGGNINVILYGSDNAIKYYGTLGYAGKTEGSVVLDLSCVEADSYRMAVYEEDVTTGYASTPVICTLNVTEDYHTGISVTNENATQLPVGGTLTSGKVSATFSSLLGTMDTDASASDIFLCEASLWEANKSAENENLAQTLTMPAYGGSDYTYYVVVKDDTLPAGYLASEAYTVTADYHTGITITNTNEDVLTTGDTITKDKITASFTSAYGSMDGAAESTDIYLCEASAWEGNKSADNSSLTDTLTVPGTEGYSYYIIVKDATLSAGFLASEKQEVSGLENTVSFDANTWYDKTQDGITWHFKLDEKGEITGLYTETTDLSGIIDAGGTLNIPNRIADRTVRALGVSDKTQPFIPASATGFTSISIPTTVETIRDYAFYGSTAAATVTIPANVSEIGAGAFYQSGITGLTINGMSGTIGSIAFAETSSLSEVRIQGGTEGLTISKVAFRDSGIEALSIGGKAVINKSSFKGNSSLSKVSLSGDISVGEYAFLNDTALADLELDGTLSIGSYAFYGCNSLTNLYLPEGTTLAKNAFSGLTSLAKLETEADLTSQSFADCGNITTLILGEGVETVAYDWEGGVSSNAARIVYVENKDTAFTFYGNITGTIGEEENEYEELENTNSTTSNVTPKGETDETERADETIPQGDEPDTDTAFTLYVATGVTYTGDFISPFGSSGNVTVYLPASGTDAGESVTAADNILTLNALTCANNEAAYSQYYTGTAESVTFSTVANVATKLENDGITSGGAKDEQTGVRAYYEGSILTTMALDKGSMTVLPLYGSKDGTDAYASSGFYVVRTSDYASLSGSGLTETALKNYEKNTPVTAKASDLTGNTGSMSVTVIVLDNDDTYTTTLNIRVEPYDEIAYAETTYGSYSEIAKALIKLDSDVKKLTEDLKTVTKERDDLQTSNEELDQKVADLTEELDSYKAMYEALMEKLNDFVASSTVDETGYFGQIDNPEKEGEKVDVVYIDGTATTYTDTGKTTADGKTIYAGAYDTDDNGEDDQIYFIVDAEGVHLTDAEGNETGASYSDPLGVVERQLTEQLEAVEKQLSDNENGLADVTAALKQAGYTFSDGMTVEETYEEVVKDIKDLDSKLGSAQADIATYQKGLDDIYKQLTDKSLSQDNITSINTALSAIKSKISTLQASIGDESTVVTNLKAEIEQKEKEITKLQGDNETLTNQNESLNQQLEDAKANSGGSGTGTSAEDAATIANLRKQVSDKETTIQELQEQIAALQNTAEGYMMTVSTANTLFGLSLASGATSAQIQAAIKEYVQQSTVNSTTISSIQQAVGTTKTGTALVTEVKNAISASGDNMIDDSTVSKTSNNYKTGYSAGYKAGYTAGGEGKTLDTAVNTSSQSYTQGYNVGYNEGYTKGTSDTSTSSSNTETSLKQQLASETAQVTSLTQENSSLSKQIQELKNQLATASTTASATGTGTSKTTSGTSSTGTLVSSNTDTTDTTEKNTTTSSVKTTQSAASAEAALKSQYGTGSATTTSGSDNIGTSDSISYYVTTGEGDTNNYYSSSDSAGNAGSTESSTGTTSNVASTAAAEYGLLTTAGTTSAISLMSDEEASTTATEQKINTTVVPFDDNNVTQISYTNGKSVNEIPEESLDNIYRIVNYYSNNVETLGSLGSSVIAEAATDEDAQITMTLAAAGDVEASPAQEKAFERGESATLKLSFPDIENGAMYLIVHEDSAQADSYEVCLDVAENDLLTMEVSSLSPIAVAKINISNVTKATALSATQNTSDDDGTLLEETESTGNNYMIVVILFILVVLFIAILFFFWKNRTGKGGIWANRR